MKDTRRLHSGRVSVRQPSQVTSDRYQFLDLASAEPNLGTASNSSVLTTNTIGQRIWTANLNIENADVSSNIIANRIYSDNIYFANGQPYISATNESNIYNGQATAGSQSTLIDTFSSTGVRTVKWILSARDNTNNTYKSSTIDSVTDGTSIYYNEYGVVLSSAADVATFTVTAQSGNISLYALGDSNNVPITFQRTTLGSGTQAGTLPGVSFNQNSTGSGTATTCVTDSYTGNGSQVNFVLSVTPTDENQTLVSIGGVLQPTSSYSLSGATLTLSSAPVNGVSIEVRSFITTTITGYSGSRGYTGSAGLLTNWTKKTSNYTAISGDRIIADTTGGAFNITLPAAPSIGSYVQITDGANFHTTPLTVLPNGSTIEGQSVNVLIDTAAVDVQFVYDGATWQIISTYGPVGYTGSAGPAGGYTGSAGVGYTGSQGTTGYTGSAATGVTGYSGSAGGAGLAGDVHIEGITRVNNDILPTVANVINLGSPSMRFGTLYLAGNTIDIGGAQIVSTDGNVSFQTTSGNIDLNSNVLDFLSNISIQGPAGAVGYTGSKGDTGYVGSQGNIGYTGSAGLSTTFATTTIDVTATVNTTYLVDTTSGNVTVTLPGSPQFGQTVGIIDGAGTSKTNQITVLRNGNKIQGLNSDLVVNNNRAAFTLVYFNAANGWVLTSV